MMFGGCVCIIQFRKILIVSMQVGVDVKCMCNKFDECGLFRFGDFDSFLQFAGAVWYAYQWRR